MAASGWTAPPESLFWAAVEKHLSHDVMFWIRPDTVAAGAIHGTSEGMPMICAWIEGQDSETKKDGAKDVYSLRPRSNGVLQICHVNS